MGLILFTAQHKTAFCIMTAKDTLWKRIVCSIVLAVFSLSAVAGSICTGHQTAHAADQGWLSSAAFAAALAASVPEGVADGTAGDEHRHGHGGHSHGADGACEPPVYAIASTPVDVAYQALIAQAVLSLDVILAVWVMPQPLPIRELVRPRLIPDRVLAAEDPFHVSARLRI